MKEIIGGFSTDAVNVFALIADQVRTQPDAPAILAPGKQTLSFSGLQAHLDYVRDSLSGSGISREDHVGCMSSERDEMAILHLGIQQVATSVPLNRDSSAQELASAIERFDLTVIVTDEPDGVALIEATKIVPVPVIAVNPRQTALAGVFDLEQRQVGPPNKPAEPRGDDRATLLYTSGTTGRPRVISDTHWNQVQVAYSQARSVGATPADRCLNSMPLFHGAGIHLELVGALSLGASVVIASFNPSRFLNVLKEFKPTWFNLAPAMHGQILQHVSEEAIKEANLPLRFVRTGSAPMSEGMHAEIERIFGVPLVQVYGSTESHFMASTSKFVGSEPRHGSVGKTHPGVAIMSASGARLETGDIGEVWVRGEVVATEYYKDPEATAERFVDGWYRTGDSGYIDTEGYLFLTGRISDHISRGGENISPGEVEAVLESHELIAQAVGFSIPHPTLGQEVAAACVLTPGSALTSLEIRTFAAKGLSWSKVPKQIHIVDELPLGAIGKVSRKQLSEIYGADSDSAEPYSASG